MATRIGIISDTHGLVRPEALRALEGSDRIVHAGDIGTRDVLAALAAIAPVTAVRGNNDTAAWARTLGDTAAVETDGVRLWVLHDVGELDLSPRAARIAAVIAGHSHRPSIIARRRALRESGERGTASVPSPRVDRADGRRRGRGAGGARDARGLDRPVALEPPRGHRPRMNAARLGIVCLLVLSCGGSEPTQGPPPTEGGESGGAGAPTTCAAVSCLVGTRCIEGPEGAHCEDAPAAPACGGIAGRTCPGAGRCVDDPSDSCDPNHGGADCGGVCACNAEGLCIEGNRWDHSPEVCDCVPKGS